MHHPPSSIESFRLEALARYDVADTVPEVNFDRVTILAARLFDVPIALVSLVDRTQLWFKSCLGLPTNTLDRDGAFCAYTILQDEVFIVPDAAADSRFSGHGSVAGAPHLRFYAGAPLITSSGFRLGALCVLDTRPRTFSPSQAASLRDLAAMVMQEMEARLTHSRMVSEVAERQTAEARRRAMFDAALDGIITINHEGRVVELNHAAETMFGYTQAQAVGQELAELIIPPAYRAAHRRGMAHFLATGEGPVLNKRLELSAVNAEGREFPIELAITRIVADGPPVFTGHIRDITERKRIEATLRENEERLRLAMDTARQGTWDWNVETDEVRWCREHNAMYGLPLDQRMGSYEEWLQAVHPKDRERAARELQAAAESRQDYAGELRSLHPDGSVHWIAVHGRTFYNAAGKRVRMLGVVQDITARRATEERLRMLESSVEHANDAIVITEAEPVGDPGPRIIYVNQAFVRTTGYSAEEVYGKTPRILQGPDTSPEAKQKIKNALKRWKPVRVELLNYRKDGSEFWVELNIVPVANEKGWYTHWVSVQRDITERRRVQKQIEDHDHLLSSVIDGTDNIIFLKDRQSRYLLINPAGARILNRTPAEVIGKDDSAFFPPEETRQIQAYDQEVMRLDRPMTTESRDVINGVEHVFESTKSPYRDAAGQLLGVIGIVREVTAVRRAADALQQAKEEAERANLAKSEFLSRMSHELRTPLNAILGFGQLLEMSVQTERQLANVSHILKGGKHLLGLINEVLDIARIESGHMELSLEPIAVDTILGEAVALVQPLATQRSIRVGRSEVPQGKSTVLADHQRLRQVLLNLLSNAVKYNRPGGTVKISCGAAGEPGFLRLSVTDTGLGIAPESLGKLFVPFERLGAERTAVEGTGIGLALSKRLVEAMDGRIGVDTVVGQGSTFYLELPVAGSVASEPTDTLAAIIESIAPEQRSTVLCIEDNLSNYALVEQTLETKRPHVRLLGAMRGQLGLAMARQHRPDLILLDLQLPDLPGDQLLQQLRTDESTRDIPVILVSADATKGQSERLLGLGAQGYLTKPLDIRSFLRSVDEVLASKA